MFYGYLKTRTYKKKVFLFVEKNSLEFNSSKGEQKKTAALLWVCCQQNICKRNALFGGGNMESVLVFDIKNDRCRLSTNVSFFYWKIHTFDVVRWILNLSYFQETAKIPYTNTVIKSKWNIIHTSPLATMLCKRIFFFARNVTLWKKKFPFFSFIETKKKYDSRHVKVAGYHRLYLNDCHLFVIFVCVNAYF